MTSPETSEPFPPLEMSGPVMASLLYPALAQLNTKVEAALRESLVANTWRANTAASTSAATVPQRAAAETALTNAPRRSWWGRSPR